VAQMGHKTRTGETPMADYNAWMARVEAQLDKLVGCGSLDLPDWGYRDAYENGMTPSEAARDAVEEAGGF
jgi:hypothetical protein